MRPYFLRPLATRSGGRYGSSALLKAEFDYKSLLKEAHLRDDAEGQREAEENPDDLCSEPADDLDEDDLPDFDPPNSPPTSPPTSPLPEATSSDHSSESISDIGSDSEDDGDDDDDSGEQDPQILFAGRILSPTPFAGSQFACNLPSISVPSTNTQDTAPVIPSKRERSPAAKAANKARKDRKKNLDIKERRRDGELPIHGEAYIRRHAQSQFVSRDFSVLNYSAVRGGDTGMVGASATKGKAKGKANVGMTLPRAAKKGFSYFPWNGMYILFHFSFLYYG